MIRLLTLAWLVFLFMVAAAIAYAAPLSSRFEIKQIIMEEAEYSNVPVGLVMAVAKVESDFNARALSSKGARGVMQIMPKTARAEFGVHPERLWDARTNIKLGIQFLQQLHDQYNGRWDLALSHYNGGTVKGSTPHKRTEKYIQSVSHWQRIYDEQSSLWAQTHPPAQSSEEIDRIELSKWQIRDENGFDDEEQWITRRSDYDTNDTPIIIVQRAPAPRWRAPDWAPRRNHGPAAPHRFGRPPPPFH